MGQNNTLRTRTCSEYAQVQSHGVVLEHCQEEHAKQQERPDEHVCQDPCRQAMRAHHCSSTPEERHEIPSQWSRNHRDVNKRGCGRVVEVEESQVEEVEHEHEFSRPEVRADPEK